MKRFFQNEYAKAFIFWFSLYSIIATVPKPIMLNWKKSLISNLKHVCMTDVINFKSSVICKKFPNRKFSRMLINHWFFNNLTLGKFEWLLKKRIPLNSRITLLMQRGYLKIFNSKIFSNMSSMLLLTSRNSKRCQNTSFSKSPHNVNFTKINLMSTT